MKLRALTQPEPSERFTPLVLIGFAVTVTIFEALGCFYHFCECQKVQPSLSDEDIVKTQKKREMDE